MKGQSDPVLLKVRETEQGPLMNAVQEVMHLVTTYAGKVHMERPFSLRWAGVEHPLDKFEIGLLYITDTEATATGASLV